MLAKLFWLYIAGYAAGFTIVFSALVYWHAARRKRTRMGGL